MKNLILLELCFIFLATSFPGNAPPPPGWFPQVRPVNDVINDITFIDTLNGWAVTNGSFNSSDTGYIFKTTNGGENWFINFFSFEKFTSVQFINLNTGYIGGGSNGSAMMTLLKTTNSGINWERLQVPSGVYLDDIFFINSDSGWICSNDLFGGLYRTTNGGSSWQLQAGASARPLQMYFLNSDTGWFVSGHSSGSLYRTTNSGLNWNLQYSFPAGLGDVYFFNADNGVVTSGRTYTTTNGGFNWTMSPSTATGGKMSFADDSVGWATQNSGRIAKTLDGGGIWFYQTSTIASLGISSFDSLKAWAGGSGIVHTTDGGGLSSITQIGTELPTDYILYQNYPNPFNPTTKIRFSVKGNNVNVKITIYDISGKLISEIINQNFSSGTYETDFNSNNLTSGVYFYTLNINDKTIDTKKMLMIK